MGKKLPTTPRSRVRAALRQLFLRSRERAACLKAAGHKCQRCGVKASVAKGKEQKIEVHHLDGVQNWEEIFRGVYEYLLVAPEKMECLCPKCHEAEHPKVNQEFTIAIKNNPVHMENARNLHKTRGTKNDE